MGFFDEMILCANDIFFICLPKILNMIKNHYSTDL